MWDSSNLLTDDGGKSGEYAPRQSANDVTSLENSTHRAIVLSHIASGAIPLKFAYTGSGAWAHDNLAKSQAYTEVVGSVALEAATLRVAAPPSAMRQLVDVGPGNGRHTAALLTELASRKYFCGRYLGLDFSQTLLGIAGHYIRRHGQMPSPPTITMGLWDAEHGETDQIELWRSSADPVLLCMLGNTLGNVENPARVLAHLWQSLRKGDLLLLGLAACSTGRGGDAYLAPYRSSDFRNATLEPLRMVGIDPGEIKFTLRYKHDMVEADAVLGQRVVIDGVTLEAGHLVRCFKSRRFTSGAVVELLRDSDWSVQTSEHDNIEGHLVVVARRD